MENVNFDFQYKICFMITNLFEIKVDIVIIFKVINLFTYTLSYLSCIRIVRVYFYLLVEK